MIFFLCFLVLLGCGKGTKKDDSDSPTTALNHPSTDPSPTTFGNNSEPVSIQDRFMVEATANTSIDKVVNTIKEISLSCEQYESINLSTNNYLFSENSTEISVSLGDEKVTFFNFSVSHWNDYNNTNFFTDSTTLKCNSTSSVIAVSLSNNIQLSAKLKITNSTGEEIIHEGTTAIILKTPIISYQIQMTSILSGTNNFNDTATIQLSYNNLETNVQTGIKYRVPVLKQLDVIITKMETSLREFFAKQLVAKMNTKNIFPASTCIKMMKNDSRLNTYNTSQLNYFPNNPYVIPTVEHNAWKNSTLPAGLIRIYELFTFNKVEFITTKTSVYDVDPQDELQLCNHTVKVLQVRIKTDAFKGQLEWQYNLNSNENGSKPFNTSFSANYVDIECKIMRNKTYFVSATIDTIEINTPSVISSENERGNISMSEYLKSVITESIAKSITEKLDDKALSYDCVDPLYDQ